MGVFSSKKVLKGITPKVRVKEALKVFSGLEKANDKSFVLSCHDLSEGGLSVALSEMVFSSNFGAEINLRKVLQGEQINDNSVLLFSESNSRFLVEVKKGKEKQFENLFKGIASKIGLTKKENKIIINGLNGKKVININSKSALKAWERKLNW